MKTKFSPSSWGHMFTQCWMDLRAFQRCLCLGCPQHVSSHIFSRFPTSMVERKNTRQTPLPASNTPLSIWYRTSFVSKDSSIKLNNPVKACPRLKIKKSTVREGPSSSSCSLRILSSFSCCRMYMNPCRGGLSWVQKSQGNPGKSRGLSQKSPGLLAVPWKIHVFLQSPVIVRKIRHLEIMGKNMISIFDYSILFCAFIFLGTHINCPYKKKKKKSSPKNMKYDTSWKRSRFLIFQPLSYEIHIKYPETWLENPIFESLDPRGSNDYHFLPL